MVELRLRVPLNDDTRGGTRNQLLTVFDPLDCEKRLWLLVLALGDELRTGCALVISGLREVVGLVVLAEGFVGQNCHSILRIEVVWAQLPAVVFKGLGVILDLVDLRDLLGLPGCCKSLHLFSINKIS